ncbi:MAG: AbrB/MazE/SpoVT family DNA-binding domain-containing protein, partial [Candidatus Bathyarchaeia archaeon]
MEYRKVQRVGASTLAISLPNEWVKELGLKKGDVIFFDQEGDGTLKLMTVKQMEEGPEKVVEINADHCKDPSMLGRILMAIYSLGYNTIKVMSTNRLKIDQLDTIRNVTRELMGIGVMEETHNYVILQSSIDVTKFPLDTLLRRLYVIASTM